MLNTAFSRVNHKKYFMELFINHCLLKALLMNISLIRPNPVLWLEETDQCPRETKIHPLTDLA